MISNLKSENNRCIIDVLIRRKMKNVGIICEYNPFHNGHKYQLKKAREISGADNVICIMSGSFVQRGEPAAWNKWSRAEMAVRNGADLVIELPVVCSCQSAEVFATGAIKILNQMKVLDSLCFGSESGKLKTMFELAVILADEPAELKFNIQSKLGEGLVFPKAYQLAVLDYLKSSKNWNEADYLEAHSLLLNPNNILGLEYLKALILSNSKIEPLTIKRIGSAHNDNEIKNDFASATSIRREIIEHGFTEKLEKSLPFESLNIIETAGKITTWENFKDILFYKLRSTDINDIQQYAYISEGIENRILSALLHSTSVSDLIDRVKTKRYTRTSIQRILAAILIGIKKDDIKRFKEPAALSYIRVLALNKNGGKILREMKKLEVENIINKFASFKSEDPGINRMLTLDVRATEVYFSVLKENSITKKPGLIDFLQSPIIV